MERNLIRILVSMAIVSKVFTQDGLEVAPPKAPQVIVEIVTFDSITVILKKRDNDSAPLHGFSLHYKSEFGEWGSVVVSIEAQKHTLENLRCGSKYQIYANAYNTIGSSEKSEILNLSTEGSKPIKPEKSRFIEVASDSIGLHLPAWKDGGCRISHFVLEYKTKDGSEWFQMSSNVKPGGNFVVLDLEPAHWYILRVTAHNSAGFTVAEYEVSTLTVNGATIAPPSDQHSDAQSSI